MPPQTLCKAVAEFRPDELKKALGTIRARMLPNAARGVSNELIRHFLARGQGAKHRPGFPRSGYWATAARSVQTEMTPDAARVRVHAPGIRLHLRGGVVRPVEAKRLALPLRPELADKRPKEAFGRDLGPSPVFVMAVKGKPGAAYLARRDRSGRPILLYLLLTSATHRGDPTVLPSRRRLLEAAASAARLVPE